MNSYLVLESGELFSGNLVGDWTPGMARAGEVVFNTSHSGYEEIATDPSYFSQIVVYTAPMQGNYGTSEDFRESRAIWAQGVICLQMQKSERNRSWLNRLRSQEIPVLEGVDTRHLVLRLREKGTPWGAIVAANSRDEALALAHSLIAKKKAQSKDWVWETSRREPIELMGDLPQGPRCAILDLGCKENIVRLARQRSSLVKIFPSRTSGQQILDFKPQVVILSNGPGDPADVQESVETIRRLVGRVPIFGICMGHQLLSLALGAKTFRLRFGHRGANHPISDQLLNKVYVSSQNHGYAVDPKTLPDDVQLTHTNLNDQTCAGIFSKDRKILSVQFHPEACPGPHDSMALFDYFIETFVNGGTQ